MRTVSFALLLLTAVTAGAQPRSASDNGLDPARLARLDRFMASYVDSNQIAGGVALVVRDGRVVYERAVGWADRESRKRMTPDAIFRVASMSKALTSIAIMMLFEEGVLQLNTPVSRFIPQFARSTVHTRDGAVPVARAITIRDLLTHTAGISYGTDPEVRDTYSAVGLGPATGYGFYLSDKGEPVCSSMEKLASVPFMRQPGDAWVYGYATDVLGCVVERASGLSLDQFFRTRITGPLRMTSTHFFVPPSDTARFVTVYASDSSRGIVRAPEGQMGQGHFASGPRVSYSGGAGLVSTIRDYMRLLQMLLNGGELEGVRLLSPKTVALMTSNQIGTLYTTPGMGFGFGFSVVERLGADNSQHSVGTYGWGSAYGGQYRVDPQERLIWIVLLNQIPNRSTLIPRFPNVLYGALK